MIASHISPEICSRTERAFSRAAVMQLATAFGFPLCQSSQRDVLGSERVEVLVVDVVLPELGDEPVPHLAVVRDVRVEERVIVDVEQPRHVLGTLDVARRPVQRLGDPTKHRPAPRRRPRTCRVLVLRIEHPGVLAAAALRELTTSDPGQGRARQAAGDDRSSRRRGRTGGGRRAGPRARRRRRSGAATARSWAGRCSCAAWPGSCAEFVALLGGRGRADQHPVAARLVDRLHHQLVEMIEDVRDFVGIGREVGRDVGRIGSSPR